MSNERTRACPADYGYTPRALAHPASLVADTLYVAGGLYGNAQALAALRAMAGADLGPVTVVFNGDFHWLDASPQTFAAVDAAVAAETALRGNVETELAREVATAGCACGYPEWVPESVVADSDALMARLREVAVGLPGITARLRTLPMHLVARVGGERVAVVHGDACSLAGWGFGHGSLARASSAAAIARWAAAAGLRVFASSHTGLAAACTLDLPGGEVLVANNGAAGLPSFRGMVAGLLTRVATTPAPNCLEPVYGVRMGALHVDALPVTYDHAGFVEAFEATWPTGSPARRLYAARIADGPDHTPARAVRGRVRVRSRPRPFAPSG